MIALLVSTLSTPATVDIPVDANDMKELASVATFAGAAAVALLIAVTLLRRFLFVCRPNELLVVAGKTHTLPSGEKVNYTVIQAGSHWRVPFVQTVSRMDIRLMPTELAVTKVLSNGGIPLDVHAIANIKVTSRPQYTYNAVERFLTLPVGAIHMTAKQTLEGALRDVISQLTPEQVNEDRIEFANKLLETTSEVFDKLGLHLDTLKIQRVEDEAKYLVNIARTQIANALRDAENAENQATEEEQAEQQQQQSLDAQAAQQQEAFDAAVKQAAGSGTDSTEQLAKLADLKGQGVITEAEFESQKAKILA